MTWAAVILALAGVAVIIYIGRRLRIEDDTSEYQPVVLAFESNDLLVLWYEHLQSSNMETTIKGHLPKALPIVVISGLALPDAIVAIRNGGQPAALSQEQVDRLVKNTTHKDEESHG